MDVTHERSPMLRLLLSRNTLIVLGALGGMFLLLLLAQSADAACPATPTGTVSAGDVCNYPALTYSVGGDLVINSGGYVNIHNTAVTYTSNSRTITVNDGGQLIIANASYKTSNANWYWMINANSGSNLKIYDSDLQQFYRLQMTTETLDLHNNVFTSSTNYAYAIYLYSYSCSFAFCSGQPNINSWSGATTLRITSNLFNGYYYTVYFYAYGYPANLANTFLFEDNLMINSGYQTLYWYMGSGSLFSLRFEGNTLFDNGNGNWGGGPMIYYPSPNTMSFNSNTIVNNEGYGIYLYIYLGAGTIPIDMNDNVITGNSQTDLYIYDIAITSNSNVIGKITANHNGYFENSYLASVQGVYESDGSPVQDAAIVFTDASGGQTIATSNTGSDGWLLDYTLRQRHADASGDHIYAPYTVSLTDGARTGSGDLVLESDDQVVITLDDVAPPLLITSPVDGMVTNGNEVLVRGQTDVGAVLSIGGFSTQVDRFGQFEITLPLGSDGLNAIPLVVADSFGNSDSRTVEVFKDITPPTLAVTSPVDGAIIGTSTLDISGTAEPGTTLKANGALVAVKPDGSFTYSTPVGEGVNAFTFVSTDLAGNSNSVYFSITGDFTPPEIVVFTPSPGSVSGSTSLEVQGRVDRNSVVTLNGQAVEVIGTSFVGTVQGLTEGENQVQIHAVDLAGNEADLTLSVLVDLTAPALTIDSPAPDTLTGDRRISVAGTTDARSLVINGLEVTSYNPGVGSYRTQVGLKEGLNVITVTAYDENGNPFSRTTSVTLDTLAPRLEVTSPAPGYVTSASSVELMGSSEPGATLQVNGKVIFADGEFTTSVALLEGENLLTLSARDPAGNVRSLTTSVVRDSVMQLSLDHTEPTTKKEHVTIKGRAEPGATVTVADQRADVDALGRFSAEVPLALGDNRIEVSATDTVGNEASTSAEVERREATTSFVDGAQESANRVVTSLQDLYGVLLLLVVAAGMAVAYGHASRRVRAAEVKLKRARNRPPVVLSSVPTMGPTYGASGPAVPLTLPGAPGVGALAPLGGGLAAQGGVPMLMALPPTMSDPTYAAAMAGQQVVAAPTSAAEPPLDPTLQSDLDALGAKADAYEAAGWDVKKVRNYLRMATFFARKGQQEKVDTYLGKIGESFEEMDAQAQE